MYWEKILTLTKFGIKPGLDRINALLDSLGNPQHNMKTIHIAGTNGKGSTAYLISKALEAAGMKVGLYTSPHLVKFNERIKVNNKDISDDDLESAAKYILDHGGEDASFFETTTALAFYHFAEEKVDIAVIEVGLGGKWDATNVITPELAIITNIGHDHEHILGKTIEERAGEKTGIIKQNVPVVLGETKENVLELLKKICEEKGITPIIASALPEHIPWPLMGQYQEENTRTAYTALHRLNISDEHIKKGWQHAKWPGRMDQRGNILFDGAHNVDGMEKLAEYLSTQKEKPIVVLGIKKEKCAKEMLELIAPHARTLILTQAEYAPLPAQELYTQIHHPDVIVCPGLKKALELAQQEQLPIVVTGSLYLVGDALRILGANT